MKIKVLILTSLIVFGVYELAPMIKPSKQTTESATLVAKPEWQELEPDEVINPLVPVVSPDTKGIVVDGITLQPQVRYNNLNPELAGQLSSEFTPTPKKRTGGYRYQKANPDEITQNHAKLDEGLPVTRSLVSSIDAGGQATNGVNTGFLFIPADPHGAAGPNHVVNVFNTSIEFYQTDGTANGSQSLQSFFAPLSPVNFTFDPKVLYDQYEQRFVVVTLERQDTAAGDPTNSSRVLVAVSDDANPNGTWFMHAINTNVNIGGTPSWFDYPGLAIDEEVIYLTGNQFTYGVSNSFQGVRLWAIQKTGFYSGGAATVVGSLDPFAGVSPNLPNTTQPAHTYGNAPAGLGTYLVSYSRINNGTSEFWQLIRLDNPLGVPSFTHQFINVGDIEPNAINGPPFPLAPQSGTALTLATNDPRALDAVWRDGQIFATATIESQSELGETSASWWVFDGVGGAAAFNDTGIIDGEDIAAGTFTFFPSIAVNADGGVGVGFSASAPSIFPSSYFAVRSPGDAAGTMRPSQLIRSGTDFYHRTFGGPSNRWGDYTSVAVDPNDECFWVYNKHAVNRSSGAASENGMYGTAFGEFCNQDPTAGNDSINVDEGATSTALVGGFTTVLNNDSDPDAADSIGAILVSGPADASSFNLNVNGTFSYTHNGDEAPTDSFTYNACDDGTPVKCDLATVNISVNPIDDDPTAVDDTATVDENTSNNTINVLTNDTDVDGGPLQVTGVTQPTNGTTSFTASNVSYTPDTDYCNDGVTTDDFDYTINGGSSATVEVTVTCQANQDPVANNDAVNTDEDVLVSVNVLANDNDPDAGDTLSVTSCSAPSNGTVVQNGNNCDFTPSLNFNGAGGFSYAISDGNGGTDTATVTVTVDPVNDDPVAVNDNANTNEDTLVSVAVLTGDSDVDTGDTLSVTSCSAPSNGTVVLNGNNCDFTPSLNFNGSGGFSYAISDGNGGTDTATVTVTVDAVNDDPVAVNDNATTDEDTLVSVAVLSGDSDVDTGDTLSVTSCSAPSNGTVVQNGNNCDFTPGLNFNGSGGFTYAISDGNGGSDSATVSVTVNAVNDDPVAVNDNANTNEDTLVSVAVLAGDSDPDSGDTLSVTSCSGSSNGTVVLNGNNCDYTPSLNFNGTGGFSYAISDGNGGTDSATVTVSVAAVNDDPLAVNDNANANEDGAVSVAVLTGDSDPDSGDTLSVTACSGASDGSVVLNGNNCDFTPSSDFNGQATFDYSISDGNGGSDTASVTVDVAAVNDEPSMSVNDQVYVSLADIGSPPAQNLACQFDFGPADEDASQAVADMIVSITNDPDGILSSIDVDNSGALNYTFTGSAGVAEVTVSLQDDGGTSNGGDDTSVAYTFLVNVQDYVFRSDFEAQVCP